MLELLTVITADRYEQFYMILKLITPPCP